MRMINPRFVSGLVAMVWLLGFALPAQATLLDLEGSPKSISDYTGKGKWTVVMFWASDCHVCNKEAQAYVDFHFVHSDDDAEVLGISTDGKAKLADARAFIDRHKINFPNIVGEFDDVAQIYTELTGSQFVGTPSFLVYDPQGNLKAAQVGAVPTDLIEEFIQTQSVASAQESVR